jgi:dolichol-phosphate mannosyltransferase
MIQENRMTNKTKKNFAALSSELLPFGLVGFSGILINQLMLALLTEVFGMEVKYAGIIAIETSILTNFLGNNFWTWRAATERPFYMRLIRHHMVTALSASVNYSMLLILTGSDVNKYLANLIGIILGSSLNFILNKYWTFRP